jgi:6-phosphogluconolactonase (cycloisomerase 2 family)
VSVFPVKKGTIGACVQNIAFTGHGINAERQEKSHIHATVFSPKQDYLMLPDLGADKIRSLEFHPNQEKPLDSATETFAVSVPGSGPRHLAFHPNGRFCYCIEELSGTISAYMYEKGKLTSMLHLTNHLWRIKSDYSSADVHLSPDGLFLYASNRGNENNIAIYSVNPLTGLLKPLGFQSVKGDHPRNFVIDPSGKFLIVANQISGNVVVFRRNMITGLLTSTKVNIKVPGASCLQIKKYQ